MQKAQKNVTLYCTKALSVILVASIARIKEVLQGEESNREPTLRQAGVLTH
jgi:hypothetical protein